MHFLYNLSIALLTGAIRLAAFFNPKARLWVEGRRNWRTRYSAAIPQDFSNARVLWLHAASLGEFEQGRPVMEAFRAQFPEWKIVLTFFSPSGYEMRKNYPLADVVLYLPADTPQNAKDFMALVKPDLAIFVKYEFWANYLFTLKKQGTPTLLVSALFRPEQPFFQWYGKLWQKMLGCFTHFFVQNKDSAALLQQLGFQNTTVAGDTRVDRVLKIAEAAKENEQVASFCAAYASKQAPVFIAGSSWEADESVLKAVFSKPAFQNYGLIIAPHDPSELNVARIGQMFPDSIRYSAFHTSHIPQVLIIDNVGMLNTLYRYGKMAYIGGGFGKGIHNTLEPAAFGLPIIFGPRYEKFEEARQFVARGAAFSVRHAEELTQVLLQLQDPLFYEKASGAVRAYLKESSGATTAVMEFLMGIFGPQSPATGIMQR